MLRTNFLFCLSLFLISTLILGCGKNDGTTQTTSQERLIELDSHSDSVTESDFEKRFRELSEQALASEKAQDWNKAIATWKSAIELTSAEFGEDSWQTCNAKLAVEVAEKRRNFTDADRDDSARIADHQRNTKSLLQKGDVNSAIAESLKTIRVSQKVWGVDSHVTANFDEQHAQLLRASGNYQVAADFYLESLRKREKALTKYHPDYERAAFELGMLYSQVGQSKLAADQFRATKTVSAKLWGSESLQVARAENEIAVALHRSGELEEAAEAANSAASIRRKLLGADSDQYAHSLLNLGVIKMTQKEYDPAAEHLATASEVVRALGDSRQNQQLKVDIYSNHGTVELLRREFTQSESAFRNLVDTTAKLYGEEHPVHAASLFKLAVAIGNQNRFTDAEPIMLNAIAIQRKSLSKSHPDLIRTVGSYARLLEQMGRGEEAKAILASVSGSNAEQENIARQRNSTFK